MTYKIIVIEALENYFCKLIYLAGFTPKRFINEIKPENCTWRFYKLEVNANSNVLEALKLNMWNQFRSLSNLDKYPIVYYKDFEIEIIKANYFGIDNFIGPKIIKVTFYCTI